VLSSTRTRTCRRPFRYTNVLFSSIHRGRAVVACYLSSGDRECPPPPSFPPSFSVNVYGNLANAFIQLGTPGWQNRGCSSFFAAFHPFFAFFPDKAIPVLRDSMAINPNRALPLHQLGTSCCHIVQGYRHPPGRCSFVVPHIAAASLPSSQV
jgi:hypothetical protein